MKSGFAADCPAALVASADQARVNAVLAGTEYASCGPNTASS